VPVLLYRFLRYGYTFRRIPLTQGKFALVDPDDYYHLSQYKWHAAGRYGKFYAVRAAKTKTGQKRIQMHRYILNIPDGILVDHLNRNALDNRKENLRPATPAQNICNRAKFRNRTYGSKYKGVNCKRPGRLYQAQIQLNRRPIFLGSFQDEVAAAKAYDRAAKKYHGQFAALNFPQTKRSILARIFSVFRSLLNYLANLSDISRTQFSRMCTAHRKPAGRTPLSGELLTSFQSGVEKSGCFGSESGLLQFFKNICHHFCSAFSLLLRL
jgi:hypothetical protein